MLNLNSRINLVTKAKASSQHPHQLQPQKPQQQQHRDTFYGVIFT